MKFSYLFILALLVVTSTVIAQEDPTFQVNQNFDLNRACSNVGFFCDGNVVCNITLIYPDGDILVDNIVMTDQGSYRNVSIVADNNNQMGFIKAIESCNNGTDAGLDTFDVAITANGQKYRTFPHEFIIIILSFTLIIFGLLFQKLRIFQSMGSILLIIMGVITLYPGYAFINWTTLMGKGLGFSMLGFGFYFLIEHSFSRDDQQEHYEAENTEFDEESEYNE